MREKNKDIVILKYGVLCHSCRNWIGNAEIDVKYIICKDCTNKSVIYNKNVKKHK